MTQPLLWLIGSRSCHTGWQELKGVDKENYVKVIKLVFVDFWWGKTQKVWMNLQKEDLKV